MSRFDVKVGEQVFTVEYSSFRGMWITKIGGELIHVGLYYDEDHGGSLEDYVREEIELRLCGEWN